LEAIEAARHRKSHVVSIKAPIPYQTFHLQQKSLGARGALLPYSEINDLAVSSISGHIFAAGGDNIVHEWDLEAAKCLRKYEGHKEYLHSVRHLNHTQELVTGSEDGHIGLWDVRSTSKPTYLTPQQKSSSLSSSHRRVSSTTSGLYVKSVATDSSETWLASGGGKKRVADQPLSTGFMSVWHLPSRVPVYYRETPSDLYDVAFYHSDVLSVGNESSLKKWNRTSGVLLSSARSTLPGCHFCVVDETTDIVATGGYGPMIDIYTMPGVVGFSLLVEKSNVEVTSRP
jgi:WD40 repeat protein